MTASAKIIMLLVVLAIAGAALAAEFVSVQQVGIQETRHTTNAGELTRGVLVGQTFEAPADDLSGVSVMFANYSNRDNTHQVEFHLRRSLNDTSDLRVATVNASELGDNQFHRFRFDPIPESRGQSFFWFVVSPTSEPGDAVTVDLNTQDPYHLGTAFVVRDGAGAATPAAAIAQSGKPTIDTVFRVYHTVPLRQAAISKTAAVVRHFVTTWDERRLSYLLWAELAAPILAFLGLLWWLRRNSDQDVSISPKLAAVVLTIIVLLGILFRLLYALELPITNDEGNYLYDARSIRHGVLAGGDGYVKAPLVIIWISIWQAIFGNTIVAGRLASVVISALTAVPLYMMGHMARSRRVGLAVAAAWALFGAPAVFGIYVHTQSVALFFVIAGLAVLWLALRGELPRKSEGGKALSQSLRWYFVAGILFGLAAASRKSSLAVGLVPLLLIGLAGGKLREQFKKLLAVAFGFVLVMGLLLGGAYAVYGIQGVHEVTGYNSAEDGINAVDPAEAQQVLAYSLRGMTPFFRESLPIILLGVIGWGLALESFARQLLQRLLQSQTGRVGLFFVDYLLPKLLWVLPAGALLWASQFFFEYEGGLFLDIGGMRWLWWAMYGATTVIALWPRPLAEQVSRSDEGPVVMRSTQPQARVMKMPPNMVHQPGAKRTATTMTPVAASDTTVSWRQSLLLVLIPAVWLLGLVIFYTNWIKFHANYLVEFLPPLILLAGSAAVIVWDRLGSPADRGEGHPLRDVGRRFVAAAWIVVLVWALFLSNYITYTFPHTGTFEQGAVVEAAIWARDNIPLDEPIFTGAAVVPYLSGHRITLDIAHPRWYAYQFTREDTDRLNTFLPPIEEMVQAWRDSTWFLLDTQTGFSFLMEYSEIEAGLETDFENIQGVSNGSNTLTFYKRLGLTVPPQN